MKHGTRNLKLGIAFCMIAGRVFGFEATLSVNPPVISLGESAQIQVEVRDAKHPKAPNFPTVNGLTFSGMSQSSQHSWVNGKSDSSMTYSVTIYPQRTGEFKIGPFNYTVGRETRSLTGSLKVVATSGDTTRAQSWKDVVFAKITSDRKNVYVQEPFNLTLCIYSRTSVQLAGNISLDGLPKTGLSDPQWKETGTTREQVDGVLYNVRRFHSAFRAMGAGHFVFAPTVTVQIVAPQQQRRRNDFFGGFGLFDSPQTVPVDLTAEQSVVEVLPLPTLGKPKGFSGAVGRFNFHVTAAPKAVHPGDPITLTMTIIGTGNIDRILPPTLPADAPFRLFGDAVRKQGNNGVRFEQVISPRDATVTEIPPVAFSFFDSENAQYSTVKSTAIPITVTASKNSTAQVFAVSNTQVVAPSNLPFASESDIQQFSGWLKNLWQRVHPWLWTLPTVLGLGLLWFAILKLYQRRRKDTARIRRQQAPKAARAALKAADTAIRKNDSRAFYEAAGNALNAYFGNRLNLPPGEVTPHIVLNAMEQAGLETDKAKNLFDHVEAARYGLSNSQQTTNELKTVKNNLQILLRSIEKTKL